MACSAAFSCELTLTTTRTHNTSLVVLEALVAWSVFAFGGAYPWTTWPISAGAAWLAIATRPSLGRGWNRVLDGALLATTAAIAVQLIPLPLSLRTWLSPHQSSILTSLTVGHQATPWRPLSLTPTATLNAGLFWVALVVIFCAARQVLASGGVRRLVRAISRIGLLVSLVALVQRAASPRLIYGFWKPFDASADPYGPFVNRNHLVAWLLMAIPLVAGYALVRTGSSHSTSRGDAATDIWLGGSAIVMTAMIFVSLSRSGIISLAAVGLIGVAIVRRHLSTRQTFGVAGATFAAVLVIAVYANVPSLLARFDRTVDGVHPGVDRRMIWRDTASIVGDFPLTGVGVGAFAPAMLVYQSAIRSEAFFNHAHNQYLQTAAEGGVLVVAPALVAIFAFAASARRRLHDQSGLYWLRGAALMGVVGVAVQSIWDVGLMTPANAVLFALLAAIAVHERETAQHRPQA